MTGRCLGCCHPSGSVCGGCGSFVDDGWNGKTGQQEACCEDGPAGHTRQQHHDASPCYDQGCRFDHPLGGPFGTPDA